MDKQHQSANNFPFTLVEEGIKKNLASERLRQYIDQKICERVDLEMRYIKQLHDWSEESIQLLDVSECYLESEIVKRILNSVKSEASKQQEVRHEICRNIMADGGPYSILQGANLCTTTIPQTLVQIQEEYGEINRQRTLISREVKRHSERMEMYSHQIEELESQLTHRSRITSARRPPSRAGTRKIDEMRSRLSGLRRQHDCESEKKTEAMSQMREIEAGSGKVLKEMDRQLQEIEVNRVRIIAEQTKIFLQYLQQQQQLASQRSSSKSNRCSYKLDSVEGLLNVHWVDVRSNAKRAESGDTFKLREMFGVSSTKSSTGMDKRLSRGHGRKAPVVSDRAEASSRRSNSSGNQHQYETPSSESCSESSTASQDDSEYDTSDGEGVGIITNANRSRPAVPIDTKSTDSVELLTLPPEVRCSADITKLDPNRQFSTKMRLAKRREEPEPASHVNDNDRVSWFKNDNSEVYEEELGKQKDVKIIAICDYIVPANNNELAFKKGQTIHQTKGDNENGLCYGWVRDNILSRKQYGYFHSDMVTSGRNSRQE